MSIDRRKVLLSGLLAASLGGLPPAIARALDIPAKKRTGTIMDVEHVVILTQENRSFDHYFGALRGVRGFSDRFPAPTKNGSVWLQPDEHNPQRLIAPFHLDTRREFKYMRTSGTPHSFPDAQDAWDNGRMDAWTKTKHNHAMGYFTRADIPFQYALAEAFTLCDAYHCALHAGTDPNRLFIWTGTNDPLGKGHGPVITNQYDTIDADPDHHGGYTWTTYPERLTDAGVSWQIYQNAKDNFDDNPLVGFKLYRDADKLDNELAKRALRTRDLDLLKADVLAGTLPSVSWVVAPADLSEHPGPSSPAQGAEYISRVLDALTANPEVWAKTVFLINFDENDGYFDHVPPPAPPSKIGNDFAGESQVDTTGEYHLPEGKYQGRPYGLGPRVPLYVVSPWSKGGFVNSQVCDHTSVIRFLETRFGVMEPNISAWRRAVCGDLTSCFDFAHPDDGAFFATLPKTAEASQRAAKYLLTATPDTPDALVTPVQEPGQRPARPLPYDLDIETRISGAMLEVDMINRSSIAVVFHHYDMNGLPSRYTVAPGGRATASRWCEHGVARSRVYGPNGFARDIFGDSQSPFDIRLERDVLTIHNRGGEAADARIRNEIYGAPEITLHVEAGAVASLTLDLKPTDNWYDIAVDMFQNQMRFAGHIETGQPSMSDPAFGGPALLDGEPVATAGETRQ